KRGKGGPERETNRSEKQGLLPNERDGRALYFARGVAGLSARTRCGLRNLVRIFLHRFGGALSGSCELLRRARYVIASTAGGACYRAGCAARRLARALRYIRDP